MQIEGVYKSEVPNLGGIQLWKINEANLSHEWISPLCLYNKNNEDDFLPGQNYVGLELEVYNSEIILYKIFCILFQLCRKVETQQLSYWRIRVFAWRKIFLPKDVTG